MSKIMVVEDDASLREIYILDFTLDKLITREKRPSILERLELAKNRVSASQESKAKTRHDEPNL